MHDAPIRAAELSLALAGWQPSSQRPARALLAQVSRAGVRSIQLDAAMPTLRPRELDRSARRDLAALLRREELSRSGADLWIPADHFASPAHQDRAVQACAQTMQLLADLAQLNAQPPGVLAIRLDPDTPSGVLEALAAASDATGVRIADHAWPTADPTTRPALIGVGLDPAAVLAAGADPVEAVGPLAARLASARLSDLADGLRVQPGTGQLDPHAYRAALSIVPGIAHVILDLRQVVNQPDALAHTLSAWSS